MGRPIQGDHPDQQCGPQELTSLGYDDGGSSGQTGAISRDCSGQATLRREECCICRCDVSKA
jgi:hypothetical protein